MMNRSENPPWCRLGSIVVGCLIAFATTEVVGQAVDRIAYLPTETAATEGSWLTKPLMKLSGTIQSFDNRQVEILVSGETTVTRLRTERIVWVVPAWNDDDANNGLAAYNNGEWSTAIAGMLAALKKRPETWRQEWLSVRLATAAFAADRFPPALELIAQLDRQPLPIPMLATLPIMWHGRTTDERLRAAALTKQSAPEPLARLAAASILLTTDQRSAAVESLRSLAADPNRPVVARLADAQLWRIATPVETKASVDRWLEKAEAMPPSLLLGPLAVIAERLQAAGEAERSLELWLAVALLSPDAAHPLAAEAKRIAAEQLRQLGRIQEAERL